MDAHERATSVCYRIAELISRKKKDLAVSIIAGEIRSAQYEALLATEDVKIEFSQEGITRLAEIAFSVNERTENIGARRLYTVMEKLLEEVSFSASETSGKVVTIDAAYVNERLDALAVNEDLSRYVL